MDLNKGVSGLVKHIIEEFNKVSRDDPRYIEKRYFIITMLEEQAQPAFVKKGSGITIIPAEGQEEEQRLLSKLKREIREEEGLSSEAKILKFQ